MDPQELQADLALIRNAARQGGEIAMSYFQKNPETWMKAGESPVSAADIAVDTYLRETLGSARPNYGWLSEETVDNSARLKARRTFVVDPIDGTRAFIAGKPTWCISIAVVEEGRSVVGVLDCPVLGERYEATLSGQALCNGAPIHVSNGSNAGGPIIGGPKPMLDQLPAHLLGGESVPYVPSLAYRIAMVAKGDIDATFVKPNSHDWDLAAADLILRRAGGGLLNAHGEAPFYAGANPRHGSLVAGHGTLLDEMAKLIAV